MEQELIDCINAAVSNLSLLFSFACGIATASAFAIAACMRWK